MQIYQAGDRRLLFISLANTQFGPVSGKHLNIYFYLHCSLTVSLSILYIIHFLLVIGAFVTNILILFRMLSHPFNINILSMLAAQIVGMNIFFVATMICRLYMLGYIPVYCKRFVC